jgi:hypothetical protein
LNSQGKISLQEHSGGMEQKVVLESEGVHFSGTKISLSTYEWKPSKALINKLLKGIPKHIPYSMR